VYDRAVGGFSTELTRAQVSTLERDPAVAAIVEDEEIHLDEGSAGFGAGGIRTTANPRASIPAGIRRVGAQRNALARAPKPPRPRLRIPVRGG
ncbi:MAG: protease inhibitor I9 family protein, partial [Candidatus Limnocylindrales bacterium]